MSQKPTTEPVKPADLTGEAMDNKTLDSLLLKEPIKALTDAELRAVVEKQRRDRAAWNLKQEKKGKEE